MTAPTDPVTVGLEELSARVAVYGGALLALVVLAVGIWLGIRYLQRGSGFLTSGVYMPRFWDR